MDEKEIIRELTETTARSKSNTKRIDKLEETQEEIRSLATSTAVMAERLGTVESNVTEIKETVTEMKDKPGKKWDTVTEKILWAFLAAVITFLLSRIGM